MEVKSLSTNVSKIGLMNQKTVQKNQYVSKGYLNDTSKDEVSFGTKKLNKARLLKELAAGVMFFFGSALFCALGGDIDSFCKENTYNTRSYEKCLDDNPSELANEHPFMGACILTGLARLIQLAIAASKKKES